MSQPHSDQDSPWKEILRQYFQQALEFFFPQTAALIDWYYPLEFLDKEFQQITLEAEIGRRYADQLVKVHLKQGQELWILVHLEIKPNQSNTLPNGCLCTISASLSAFIGQRLV
jgi:hypothetical protein